MIFCNKICETGDADFCKACDEINKSQCGTCNYGYYIPTHDLSQTKCKKCDDLINNCEECYGSKKSIECKKYNNDYFLNTEKNIWGPLCQTGPGNNCNTCNKETIKCDSCNSGYYLPSDDEEKKCKNCSDIMITVKNVMNKKILLNVHHVKLAIPHYMMKIMKFWIVILLVLPVLVIYVNLLIMKKINV